jgi:hypothetical protein
VAKSTHPVRCYRCDSNGTLSYTISVDGGQQKLTVRGKKLNHAHARCSNNHEWWSLHKAIVAASREADASGQAVTLTHGAT